MGVLAIVGDRGLAGSYNSGVLRATERLVAEHARNGADVTLWTVGKKAPSYFRYRGIEIERSFPGIADRPEFVDARAVAAAVTGPFVAGEMDLVQLVSTRFISAGTQRVEMQQMLPLPLPDEDEGRGRHRPTTERRGPGRATPSSSPSRRSCWPNWRPRPPSPRSSPPCSKGRPRSSPPSNGPWRRRPTTPTSWSGP